MRDLLVLRLSALGDVIHTIPAVLAIRSARPEWKISWAVEAAYAEVVRIVAGVSPVPVRLKAWARTPLRSRGPAAGAVRTLRGHRTSIDFQGLVKSAMLGVASGATERYGFDRAAARERISLLFTNRRVRVDPTRHVVEQNLELAAGLLGAPSLPCAPDDPDVRAAFLAFAADPEGRLAGLERSVVLLPGAGRPEKIWPADRFRQLADRIGQRALVVWGPSEKDLAEEIGGRLAPPTGLRELAWLLLHAQVVIGGDTGPLHLAAALGTPVVGLYGPTDPRRSGPWGQLANCLDRFETTKWIRSISVEDVMRMFESVEAECR